MRAYEFQPAGSAFQIQMVDRPSLPLPAGYVRIRVRATSLNYRDLINLKKLANREVAGRIPLSDGAGEIVEVSPGITRFQPGDRVAVNFFRSWLSGPFDMAHHKNDLGGTIDGMLAEEVIFPADSVVAVPASMTFEEAATLPCAALTAWQALVERRLIQPGQTMLALGTGGVSVFALQMAHAAGAKTIITSRSAEKLERAKALGADHTILTSQHPDWDQEVHRLTDKRGVDHIIEVGGPGTLEKSLASVAPGGVISLIGVLTGFGPPQTSLFPLVAKNASMHGIYVGSVEMFERMNQFLVKHQIRPQIDRVFSWTEAKAAFAYLESGSHFGKVVIRID